MVSRQRLKRSKENAGKTIVRFLTEKMYKKITKRQPVRMMVAGAWVEIRSKNQKELKEISKLQAKIKELKAKVK